MALPNIRGMDIPQARQVLAPHGWRPADFRGLDPENAFDAATRYRKQGLTEFETCSGTGYGFCALRYTHSDGAVLDVATTGDEPAVSGYRVQCPEPQS